MRTPLFVANWKMHKTVSDSRSFFHHFEKLSLAIPNREVVFCPPFTLLAELFSLSQNQKAGWKFGAQDLFWEAEGAYTGEISPVMLKDLGCEYVLVAHSERRKYFSETDETANRKIFAALSHGLAPVLCIGETLREMEQNKTRDVLSRQLRLALKGLEKQQIKKMIFAYEPVWAIGTGKSDSPEKCNETGAFIRKVLMDIADSEASETIRILYGGSVTPENISGFMEQPNVDGALVGGAGLEPDRFARIVAYDCGRK